MRVIDQATIKAAVSVDAARQVVADAFCALSEGTVTAPDEFAMRLPNGGEFHAKGAALGGATFAVKAAAGGFPNAPNHGFTAVFDSSTGEPLALLADGGWLTEVRTAAAAAVSAQALARPGPLRLALLGTGTQAAFQLPALRAAVDVQSVVVWSPREGSRAAFASAHDAEVASTPDEAVVDADLVVTCTPARSPFLRPESLVPGVHVIAVGADMVGKRELCDGVMELADVVVADDVDLASRVGELAATPALQTAAVALGDVLTGRAAGRMHDRQRIVSDHCGLGVQDAAIAELVLAAVD
ncbi:MAG: hypothetical protein AAGA37_02495 [Actinomycetota bacterium]